MPWPSLPALARNRLVHFVVLGGALFALGRRDDPRRVDVDPTVLATLRAAEAKRQGLPDLPATRTRELEARAIEDEILYREALRLGLDRDDPIVRQRLVQKLLALVEDLGGASRPPTEAQLREHLATHGDRFARAPRVRFIHVFATRLDRLPGQDVLADATSPPAAGEPFPYPRAASSTQEEMARTFGPELASAVHALADGAVSSPLRSPFGWHRVRALGREDGGAPAFEAIRKEVLLDFLLERRERVVGRFVGETVAAYDVRVGGRPLTGFAPTRRVAVRPEESAED